MKSKTKPSSKKAKVLQENEEDIKKKMQSLISTKGKEGFSGSSYNSKGSVDHGKIVSNKKRR